MTWGSALPAEGATQARQGWGAGVGGAGACLESRVRSGGLLAQLRGSRQTSGLARGSASRCRGPRPPRWILAGFWAAGVTAGGLGAGGSARWVLNREAVS